ncbi:MAG TPA: tetratricopeptide repeat protein [Terriglobales bacterium]|nr:tetratricopeptide repeat protein [Terriglobales bacterium]
MVTKPTGKTLTMKKPAKPSSSPMQDPQFAQAVQNYEGGLRAMQERKFDKAKAYFQKIVSSGPKELADRASVHLNACNQQLAKTSVSFKTPAEHYDYVVSLMNVGDFVTAREHLEQLVSKNPKLDYIWYGFSVLECLTGHVEESLKKLNQAIQLNPANRFQARSDTDFNNMADDPRFTELLYPEPGASDTGSWSNEGRR